MRVAVLGAGYAGLTLARKLQGTLPEAVELVVVDEREAHLLQHELHRVIRRPELADEITVALEDVLECAVIQARVTDVDPSTGIVSLEGNDSLAYDVGVVCLGATPAYHGIEGVRTHATPLKRLKHARTIRDGYEHVLERGGQVVVGGAGLSGVQVAGELAEMAIERERDGSVDVVVVEQLDAVAPGFPEQFQRAVRAALEAREVTVRTETAIESATEASITLAGGETIEYDQFVWTGGISGPAPLSGDRPVVRSDLRLAGDTFAMGDAVRVVDADGEAVPASAQAAVSQAAVCARNVRALIDHRIGDDDGFEPRLDRFAFDARGWLVSVGDGAVAQVGGRVLTGRAALALKTSVGAGYLGRVGAVGNALDLVRDGVGDLVSPGEPGAGEESTVTGEESTVTGEESTVTDDGDEDQADSTL